MPLRYLKRFRKQYLKLPEQIQSKVDKALGLLDVDFRHPGLRSHPVQGYDGVYEAYVDQKYRLTFERHGDVLLLRNVDNHDDCLKNP